MRFVRYQTQLGVAYGIVEGDLIRQITTTPFEAYEITDHQYPLSQVKLLAPCAPTKILATGLNYKSHLGDLESPKHPEIFYKVPSSVIGSGDVIVLPKDARRVEEEAELVVVIGRRCRKVSKGDALGYVLGYTCGNDVSAREWQRDDMQWWRAKSSDTFSPVGPYIATGVNGSNLDIWAKINGTVVQHCNTSELLFDIPTIVSFVSQVVTLEPGDLVFTGTSGRPAELKDGDVVEIEAEGIGTLGNAVKSER
ncbi:MAG: fumarylacetoacetate hydrolase family protein [Chloroflexi bacterium]|nr:fumarylacetoacetate hydrolase family protein [Chloroflexota bacterium]